MKNDNVLLKTLICMSLLILFVWASQHFYQAGINQEIAIEKQTTENVKKVYFCAGYISCGCEMMQTYEPGKYKLIKKKCGIYKDFTTFENAPALQKVCVVNYPRLKTRVS